MCFFSRQTAATAFAAIAGGGTELLRNYYSLILPMVGSKDQTVNGANYLYFLTLGLLAASTWATVTYFASGVYYKTMAPRAEEMPLREISYRR